ncbi:hypothetical protein H9M94_01025 [Mycoplasma sp. Pen4]|uniref:hypothetical protein n=1 Tax=Mycoplasma sp. Pen4 TaxID=640330 RepID=UPI0016543F07|nr:hypothetical protein [Mycoplasma sp. Pen4]QNM93841.1 hypothetical protein H9M94_01025 [Mycoplasma sp. Pen4]
MDMKFMYFAVEKTVDITSDDLSNFREFYGPFLGADPVFLYHYLIDSVRGFTFKQSSYDFFALTSFLNTTKEQLDKSRKQLEAVGLINTFADNNRNIMVFSIQKPLNASGIKNNKFISDLLRSRIGAENYKNLVDAKLRQSIYKETHLVEDVTTDFFDMFSVSDSAFAPDNSPKIIERIIELGKSRQIANNNAPKINQAQNVAIKLEIGHTKYSNEYEAILKLNTFDFFKQMVGKEPTMDERSILLAWQANLDNSQITNYLFYIALNKTTTLSAAFKATNSMINEITQLNILTFDEVEKYFDGKIKNEKETNIFQKKELLKMMLNG